MDLSHVIIGPIVTEKAERLKAGAKRTFTLSVHRDATKILVKHALRKYYDIDVDRVRMFVTRGKIRSLGGGRTMAKRPTMKKALVTLKPKSKPLDLASFKHR